MKTSASLENMALHESKLKISKEKLDRAGFNFKDEIIDFLVRSDRQNLSSMQRLIWLAWLYDGEVLNGGHLQFFCNQGTTDVVETCDALLCLGAIEHSRILDEAYEKYKLRDRPSIRTLVEYAEIARQGEFDDYDRRYYHVQPNVDSLLRAFVDKHQESLIEIVD